MKLSILGNILSDISPKNDSGMKDIYRTFKAVANKEKLDNISDIQTDKLFIKHLFRFGKQSDKFLSALYNERLDELRYDEAGIYSLSFSKDNSAVAKKTINSQETLDYLFDVKLFDISLNRQTDTIELFFKFYDSSKKLSLIDLVETIQLFDKFVDYGKTINPKIDWHEKKRFLRNSGSARSNPYLMDQNRESIFKDFKYFKINLIDQYNKNTVINYGTNLQFKKGRYTNNTFKEINLTNFTILDTKRIDELIKTHNEFLKDTVQVNLEQVELDFENLAQLTHVA